jgi:superfamily I DNA and/or RNA helicase
MDEFYRSETRFSTNPEGSGEEVYLLRILTNETTKSNISTFNPKDFEELIGRFNPGEEYSAVFRKKDQKRNGDAHVCIISIDEHEHYEFTLKKDRDFRGYETVSLRLLPRIREIESEDKLRLNAKCRLQFLDSLQGFDADPKFVTLYNAVNGLIPTPDPVDKEKEKKIWDKYVEAYNMLLQRKQEIKEVRVVGTERQGQLRLELIKPDEKSIVNRIVKDLTDSSFQVNFAGKESSIAFSGFQLFGEQRLEKLQKRLAPHFLDVKRVENILEARFYITENSLENKAGILSNLQDFIDEIGVNCSISTTGNCRDIPIDKIPIFQEIIRRRFPNLTHDRFKKVIRFSPNERPDIMKQFKNIVARSEYTRDFVRPIERYDSKLGDRLYVVQSFNANIIPEIESQLPVKHVKTVAEYLVIIKGGDKIKEVPGFTMNRNLFHKELNNTKEDLWNSKKSLENFFSFSEVKIRDSFFFFRYEHPPLTIEQAQRLKLDLLDIVEPSNIDENSKTITITFQDRDEHDKMISQLSESLDQYEIHDSNFASSKILFQYDSIEEQDKIFNVFENQIENNELLSQRKGFKREGSQVILSYQFDDQSERDLILESLSKLESEYSNQLTLDISNSIGITNVILEKDFVSEQDAEKQYFSSMRDATLFFETTEEFKKNEKVSNEYEKNKNEIERIKRSRVHAENWENLISKDKELSRSLKNRWKKNLGDVIYCPFRNGKYLFIVAPENRVNIKDVEYKTLYIKPRFWGEEAIIKRMRLAMDKIIRPARPIPGFSINRNIENYLFDPSYSKSIPTPNQSSLSEEYQKFLNNRIEKNLNRKQEEAVMRAIKTEDLMLLQGPPGTGKTTVIAEIIWQIICTNQRSKTLVSSQANLAVDNALDRLPSTGVVRPLRVGGSRLRVYSTDENGNQFIDPVKTIERKIKYAERFEEGFKYSKVILEIWRDEDFESYFEEQTEANIVTDWLKRIHINVSQIQKNEPRFEAVLSNWKNKLICPKKETKQLFVKQYLKYSNIVAATCMECGTDEFSDEFQSGFDYVIVDEASKATPPELILPLTFGKASIVIGDHKQLPPMIEEKQIGEALEEVGASNLAKELGEDVFRISQFEKLFEQAKISKPSIITELDTQYRMHEDIMAVINPFYQNIINSQGEKGLICGLDKGEMNLPFDAKNEQGFHIKASRDHGLEKGHLLKPDRHVVWIDVTSPETRRGTSYFNQGEIDAIGKVLKNIQEAPRFSDFQNTWQKEEDKEIGVITFYGAQLKELRNFTDRERGKDGRWRNYFNGIPIRIDTVDRFQGMERNILIVSTVRSNLQQREESIGHTRPNRTLGFANNPKRINVAFSRARRLLIIVGNKQHFSQDPLYQEVISVIDGKGGLISDKLI